jgi:hypothetical protein
MTNANRASRNAGKKAASAQSATAPKNAPGKPPGVDASPVENQASVVIPSRIVVEMMDAIALYRAAVNDAGSLALIQAANIQWNAKAFAAWEFAAGHAGFVDGVYGLARTALENISLFLDRNDLLHAPLITRLREFASPVALPNQLPFETSRDLLRRFGFDDKIYYEDSCRGENSLTAMTDLLDLLGVMLSERTTNQAGYFIAQLVMEKLKEAFYAYWDASRRLHRAAEAVQYAIEHRAAA